MTTRDELNRKLDAIITVLDEVDCAHDSTVYVVLNCYVEEYFSLRDILTDAGLVIINDDNSLSTTLDGHEMSVRVMEFARSN